MSSILAQRLLRLMILSQLGIGSAYLICTDVRFGDGVLETFTNR